MKILKTNAIIFLFFVIFSCNFSNKKQSRNEWAKNFDFDTAYYQPLRAYNHLSPLLNDIINYVLDSIPYSVSFSVDPYFFLYLSEMDIIENLSHVRGKSIDWDGTVIVYSDDELNQFIKDNDYLRGRYIIPTFTILPEYINNVNEEVGSELKIFLGPPLVDRKNLVVFIYFSVEFRIKDHVRERDNLPDHITWGKTEEFYAYKYNSEGYWDDFALIPIITEWVREKTKYIIE